MDTLIALTYLLTYLLTCYSVHVKACDSSCWPTMRPLTLVVEAKLSDSLLTCTAVNMLFDVAMRPLTVAVEVKDVEV